MSDDPIQSAVSSGNLAIVQLLQQHGATLHGRHMVAALSRGARTRLADVIFLLYITMFKILTWHLWNVYICLYEAETPAMELLRHLVPALSPDVWRECLTSPALRRGDVAVCRFLVDHGVDINFAFGSGSDLGQCTPLHHAGTCL